MRLSALPVPMTGWAASVAVAVLLLGGCTSDEEPAAGRPTTSASAGEESTPSASATEPTPGESTTPATHGPTGDTSPSGSPTSSATPTPAGPAALVSRLLPAGDLPGFNAAFRWREQSTAAGEPQHLATCNRFAMTSLGATRVVTRTYLPAGTPGLPARHLVAQLPDEATAARAYDVLTAWRRRCGARLAGYDLRRVGPLEPVTVPSGTAGWYLLTYGPVRPGSDDAVFESTGLVLDGTRVAVLDMRLEGQDFNYPRGQEPMVAAVQRAAGLL